MKILSKIKRRTNEDELPRRGEYVEMDLFDTDRNPLSFPSGGATDYIYVNGDNMDDSPPFSSIRNSAGELLSDCRIAELVSNGLKMTVNGLYVCSADFFVAAGGLTADDIYNCSASLSFATSLDNNTTYDTRILRVSSAGDLEYRVNLSRVFAVDIAAMGADDAIIQAGGGVAGEHPEVYMSIARIGELPAAGSGGGNY